MATGTISLPIGSSLPGDTTAGNTSPSITRVKSSAAAPTPFFLQANFDATTSEALQWQFQMPSDYASGLTLKGYYKMASATSGTIVMESHVMAVSDGDAQDVDADSYGTVNTTSAISVPATAGHIDRFSLTLANADSVAAGDFVVVRVGRDADNGSDSATGDLELLDCILEYTTT